MKHCATGNCANCIKKRAAARAASIALAQMGKPLYDHWDTRIGADKGQGLEAPRFSVEALVPQNQIYHLHSKREGPRRRRIRFGR